MATTDRLRVIYHGAVVLFVGLLCGYPAVAETGDESTRLWHTAHETLIMIGILMLVMSSVMQSLLLEKREAAGLRWSLLAMGYGFTVGLLIEGITGTRAFGPSSSPVLMIAFIGNAIGILSVMVATGLTLIGAHAARRAAVAAASA